MGLYLDGCVVLMVPDPAIVSIKQSNVEKEQEEEEEEEDDFVSDNQEDIKYVIAGYILFQPFFKGEIYEDNDTEFLVDALKNHPQKLNCIYTHELSIDPAFRGKGLTAPLNDYAEDKAKGDGYSWLTLVALSSAKPFWLKNGYRVQREIEYGGVPCYYMEKPHPASATANFKLMAKL